MEATPAPAERSKGGRPRGSKNTSLTVKQMIDKALDSKGGWKWLANQMDKHPVAFMNMMAKCMPLEVNAHISDFTYVVQTLNVVHEHVPGVISDGLPPKVEALPPPEFAPYAEPAYDAATIARRTFAARAQAMREMEGATKALEELDPIDAEGDE